MAQIYNMDAKALKNSAFIKSKAREIGFDHCGISKAQFLEKEAKGLESWLKQGYHGEMEYMNRNYDKRLDPRLLVEGAKSVISVILNYFPHEDPNTENDPFKISKYALGEDYHTVLKEKLSALVLEIQKEIGEINARIFVDSAPVMDKAWAQRAGLGWVGKNTNLINRAMGSFFFIGEIICDLPLTYDTAIKDFCGTCTACIDACPTDALVAPYQIDGSKCISYFTIELKNSIPDEVQGKFQNWAFGCDICQDVCPWNSFSKPHHTPAFDPLNIHERKNEWFDLTEEVFKEVFKKSAVKRTKLEGLKRNISFIKSY